ncbi:MAG: putative toxin-antitoxin system toxin component, PIN family [Christensenellales bacterium]|jgi:putative PIN family toxin of toxin-antitoxin system
MNVVIDTNVVASAIFFGGQPRRLLELLLQRKLEAFVSPEIVEEYHETVQYLQNKYPAKKVVVPLTYIIAACKMVKPTTQLHICRDPDDNKFIECALDTHCLCIVSGDKDLLLLKQVQGIQMVTVAEFFQNIWHEQAADHPG